MSRLGLSRTVFVESSVAGDALAALEASERARETEGIIVRARVARSVSERAAVASMTCRDVRRGTPAGGDASGTTEERREDI